MRYFGAMGGRARSDAKAAACRLNGCRPKRARLTVASVTVAGVPVAFETATLAEPVETREGGA
jgi:hypothetical protein